MVTPLKDLRSFMKQSANSIVSLRSNPYPEIYRSKDYPKPLTSERALIRVKSTMSPTFRSFFENLGDKAFHIVEISKSSSFAICSISHVAKIANANCGMWDAIPNVV